MFYSNNNDNEFDFSKIFENIANKQKEENNKEIMIYNKLLYGNFNGKQVLALDNKTNTIKNILDSNKSNLLSKKVFLANYCNSHEYCDSCIFHQLFNTDCFISSKVLIQDINKNHISHNISKCIHIITIVAIKPNAIMAFAILFINNTTIYLDFF